MLVFATRLICQKNERLDGKKGIASYPLDLVAMKKSFQPFSSFFSKKSKLTWLTWLTWLTLRLSGNLGVVRVLYAVIGSCIDIYEQNG